MSTNMDVAQLVQRIRAEVGQRGEKPILYGLNPASQSTVGGMASETATGLRSVDEELNALYDQIQSGEPIPASPTLSDRLGSLIKHRLYRFLWWQSNHIKTLASLMLRLGREQFKSIDALSEGLGRLNQEIHQIQQLAFETTRRTHESENRLRQLESAQLKLQAAQITQGAAQLENKLDAVRKEMSETKAALEGAEARIKEQVLSENAISIQKMDELVQRLNVETAQREQMAARLSELGMFTHQTRSTLSIQDRRLALFLEEARKRLPAPFTEKQLQGLAASHSDHKYDALYKAFEDTFRGSREEIKARQSVYLPYLKEHRIGSKEMPVLDLGCGRGEWLEFLREQGLEAQGLDLNQAMIEQCKALGLKVEQGDALSYLGKLSDSCMGAVTSLHMVEHFPFEVTLNLIDEALRVLKPGGILILETPNPQNLMVGAHTFYLDPTHIKPLPSPMLRFFVEARGFCDAHIWDLQPYPETVRFPDDGNVVVSRLNEYLYGPQDYAVIGRKP